MQQWPHQLYVNNVVKFVLKISFLSDLYSKYIMLRWQVKEPLLLWVQVTRCALDKGCDRSVLRIFNNPREAKVRHLRNIVSSK